MIPKKHIYILISILFLENPIVNIFTKGIRPPDIPDLLSPARVTDSPVPYGPHGEVPGECVGVASPCHPVVRDGLDGCPVSLAAVMCRASLPCCSSSLVTVEERGSRHPVGCVSWRGSTATVWKAGIGINVLTPKNKRLGNRAGAHTGHTNSVR